MTKKVTQATDNPLIAGQLDHEATLITNFLKMIAEAGKTLTIQLRSGIGQLSACKVDHATPKDIPQAVYTNSAWIGIKFINKGDSPCFYRTEKIGCRNAFVVWVKEKLAWLIEQVNTPGPAFKDLLTIVVPEEICFTYGTRFTTV